MKLADLLSQILNARDARISTRALIQAADQAARDFSFLPGQTVEGKVLEQKASGNFVVSLNGQSFDMVLPSRYQSGDRLSFTYVGREPLPTFLLSTPQARSAQVQLSSDARWIAAIRQEISGPGPEGKSPAALRSAEPLLTAAASLPDTPRLSQVLSQAIGKSGLFYESHLQAWVQGNYALSDLLDEPQARLPAPAPRQEPAAPTRSAHTAMPPASADTVAAAPDSIPKNTGGHGTHSGSFQPLGQALTPAAGSVEASGGPKPDKMPHPEKLLTQQLNCLETRHIVWDGQLWPGQELQVEIRAGSEQAPDPAERDGWFGTLRLELPRLGAVTARIQLLDQQVFVRLETAGYSAELLKAHDSLAQALAAADLHLQGLGVNDHGQ